MHIRNNYGFTLVELVIYIVVLSIGTVGIVTSIMMWNARTSEHLMQKQAYNIAESIMDELNAMPITFCDPQDANVSVATSYADCSIPQNTFGPTPNTETRGDALNPFDNLLDYHNWSMNGISYIDNTAITELKNYTSKVSIASVSISGIPGYIVTVTVTPPLGNQVVLETFRTAHSPRST